MKLLFVCAGLSSLRGRANSYQESLIEALSVRGHTVDCLLTALIDSRWHPHAETEVAPWDPRCRLYKIFNAGVYPALYPQGGVGTRTPRRDIKPSAWLRENVLEIIQAAMPDVISYQSIFGLPFELIRDINGLGIRTVFTIHDYFSLCPTAHLFRPDHTRCRRRAEDLDCANCCHGCLGYGYFRVASHLNRLADATVERSCYRQALYRVRNLVQRIGLHANQWPADADGYRRRREASLQMLASFTVLHCISESQRAVVRELATDSSNIHLLPLMPPSISHLSRLRQHHDGQKSQVRFVALNIHGPYKGSEILSEAFAKLEATGAEYELEILGPPPQRFFQSPRVSIGGRYALSDLDAIAGRADYCLLPSVWDETLGFTGMEMLARGVPLIASTWAGASQFVQHGVNGYTFDPDEPDSLLSLLQEICFADGDDVRSPVDWPLPKGLKPYDEHVAEMEGLLQP